MNNQSIMVSTHAPVFPSRNVVEAAWELAGLACKSGMSKARNQADAFFVIMYGYELGVSQMTSLRSIYSVGGAPACSGELMLALIRSSGKAETIKLPDSKDINDSATVYMKRRDSGEDYTAIFTLTQAQTAGLVKDGGNWKKYPKAMLLWRAVSICAKALFSDVIAGLYTLEEIAPNTPVDETGAPIGAIIEGDVVEVKPAPQLTSNTIANAPPVAPTPPTEAQKPAQPPEPPPAPENEAENGNGDKKYDLGAVHGLVAFMFETDFKRNNSIAKLLEGRNTDDPDNAIKSEDTTLAAAAKVFYHRAFADHKFDRAKIMDILNGGLTDTKVANFGEWYKLCGNDMGAALKSAWKAVQEYVEMSKLPPAKPAGKDKAKAAPKPEDSTDMDKDFPNEPAQTKSEQPPIVDPTEDLDAALAPYNTQEIKF